MTKEKAKITLPILILLLLVFQRLVSELSGFIADSIDYSSIDPYNLFARISVHHILQMAVTIIVIVILSKKMSLDFGFRLGDTKTGIKLTTIFLSGMFAYIAVSSVIMLLANKSFQHSYPLNTTNVLGTLGFQLFLSGTSEEILFRAFPITILIQYADMTKRIKIGKIDISVANLIAAVFFAIAHIKLSFQPFTITYSVGQLLFSFACGIADGYVYEKSKSVLYPMIMHSMTNVAVVGIGYLMDLLQSVM